MHGSIVANRFVQTPNGCGCVHALLRCAQGYAISEQLGTARDAPARERLAEAAVPPLMRAAAALSPVAAAADDAVSQRSAALLRSMLRMLLARLHGTAGDLGAEVRLIVFALNALYAPSHQRCRLYTRSHPS